MMRSLLRTIGLSLLIVALLLSALSLVSCQADEPTSPKEDEPMQEEIIPDTFVETVPTTLPHVTVGESSTIASGLTLIEHANWVYEECFGNRVFIMRTNMDEGVTQIDVDPAFQSFYEGGTFYLYVGCIVPLRNATLRLTYTDVDGVEKTAEAEATYSTDMQRVCLRLERPAFLAEAPEMTLSVHHALDDGLYVRVAYILLNTIDPTMPELGQTMLIDPKYDNSHYGSGAYITAVASVTQFGAIGNGTMDDTAAFEAALAYASSLGGGTVYVPEGRYALTRPIDMPDSVALVGEIDLTALNATGQVRGSILQCYAGKGDANGQAMFTLNNYSTLQSLAFWYPEQKLTDGEVIPYPYTIQGRTSSTLYGSNLENLVLVNSYRGIRFGNQYNVLEVLRNIYGTPLENGFMIGGNADIARVEGMCFSTYYWANSGLPAAPSEADILAVTQSIGTGVIVERVDWTYMFDMAVDGYRTGMLFRYTTDGINEGAANGSLYGLDITNCRCGIEIQQSHEIGLMLTDSRIIAGGYADAVAILLNSKEGTAMSILGCDLQSEGKHVIYNAGNTSLNVTDTTFGWVGQGSHGAMVHSASGALSLVGCRLPAIASVDAPYEHLYLGKTATLARAVNCGKLTVKDDSEGHVYAEAQDAKLTIPTMPEVDANGKTAIYRPDSTALVDMGAEPYAIKNGEDITDKLQAAINSLSGTGGTVYLPAGSYRVEDAIVVKSGVELRGAMDASISRITNTTTLLTDFGKNDPEGEALITLQSGAGLVGIRIGYDKQDATALLPYSYAVRGEGAEVYLRNVSFDNVWNGLDLATYRCDDHMVKGLMGVAFANCVTIGGGSRSGIVRDVLTNPAYWDINNTKDDVAENLVFIKLEDCTDQLLYANFHYAGAYGLWIGDGVKNATVVTHGTDYGNCVIYAPEGDAEVTLINSQMAPFAGGSRFCVLTGEDFDGKLSLLGASVWTAPQSIVKCDGGTIGIFGGNLLAWGSPTVQMNGGEVTLCGMSFTGMSGAPVLNVQDGELTLHGNVSVTPFSVKGEGDVGGTDAYKRK